MKEKIIAGFIIVGIVLGLCFGLSILDNVRWNDGKCSRCEGYLEFLEVENYQYYYKCDTCGWIDHFSVPKN